MASNYNSDLKKIAWVGGFTILCIAILSVSNIRFLFWDTDLFPYVESGKIAHYYINYLDFGFTKRGLVGTLLKITGSYPSVVTIEYMAFGMGLSICFTTGYAIYQLRSYFDSVSYILFAGLLIFNPGTLANLGYDLGRFDQLLILCTIFSLYFIYKGELLKLIAISIIGLLIHELFLIMFLPMLLYVTVSHSKLGLRETRYLVGTIASVLALLFFFGKIESKSFQEIAATITVEGFNFGDYGRIWKSTFWENIRYTFDSIATFSSGDLTKLALGATYTVLTFLLLIMIFSYNHLDWRGFALIFFASLPIFFLGLDYSRWYSLMIINGFVYFVFLIIHSEKSRMQITNQHRTVILLLLIIGIILGPIGIIRSFPFFNIF